MQVVERNFGVPFYCEWYKVNNSVVGMRNSSHLRTRIIGPSSTGHGCPRVRQQLNSVNVSEKRKTAQLFCSSHQQPVRTTCFFRINSLHFLLAVYKIEKLDDFFRFSEDFQSLTLAKFRLSSTISADLN